MVSEKYQKHIKTYPFISEAEKAEMRARREAQEKAGIMPTAQIGTSINSLNIRGDRDFGGVDMTIRLAFIMKAPFTIEEQGFVHNFHQYIGFASSDPKDPDTLGGEADFYFGQEGYKYNINKNTIIHIPPGVVHCPLDFTSITKPMLWLEIFTSSKYLRTATLDIRQGASKKAITAESEYAKNIKTSPFYTKEEQAEMAKKNPQAKGATSPLLRIQGLKDFGVDICAGMSFINKPFKMVDKAHDHNFHSYLCFLSSDPNKQDDLGGEAVIYLGKEKERYVINRPQAIHIPPEMVHCPLEFTRIDRPMLWLEVFTSPFYARIAEYD